MWKDSFWKTKVHDIKCKYLGQKDVSECLCPKRLASGTVENIIQQLLSVFDDNGFGRKWDILTKSRNPVAAPVVKEYLNLIKEEQASDHVLPKQAKPIFLPKIKTMCSFIDREIKSAGLSMRERYVLFRDQAWLKLKFLLMIVQVVFHLLLRKKWECWMKTQDLFSNIGLGKP